MRWTGVKRKHFCCPEKIVSPTLPYAGTNLGVDQAFSYNQCQDVQTLDLTTVSFLLFPTVRR